MSWYNRRYYWITVRSRDFGPCAGQGKGIVCFLSNNDITGEANSGPVFDKNARLIGLAFDGNWGGRWW